MISIIFIVCQLIGGILSGSIAIFADTAHLASDLLGFIISMAALKLGAKEATSCYSYGWHRAEIIGSLISIATIWVMTIWLVVEATARFFEPPQVQGNLMLIVAIMSLVFNIIQIAVLHSGDLHFHGGVAHSHDHDHDHGHGHSHSHGHDSHSHDHHGHDHDGHDHTHIATRSAMLHVLGDALMSVGVIIAATIIYIDSNLWYFDPLCTYLFSILVMYTTMPTIKNCMRILMEGTPPKFNIAEIKQDILHVVGQDNDEIRDVHDLHLWALSEDCYSLTCHVVTTKPLKNLARVTDMLRKKYSLNHTTIQVEGIDDKKKNPHAFKCENDIHP